MKKVKIKDLSGNVEQEISILGWVYNYRGSGKIMFLQLRDGSGFTQGILVKEDVSEEIWDKVQQITMESSVEIFGIVQKHPKKEEYEILVKDIQLINIAQEYPISKKEHGPDFLLENRHLWIRSKKQWAILRLRHWVKAGFQEFFNKEGFIEIDTPTFTPTSCEGTTDLFEVNYFDDKAYLTQNGQLYLEALAMSFGRVYDLCPNFRAEKSKTRKHLTEFWTLNPEMIFCDHEQSLKIQENAFKYLVSYILNNAKIELEILERDITELQAVVDQPFTQYQYGEAIEELQKRGSSIKYGEDIGAEDEVLLTEDSLVPVIIKNWPASIKPFYMKKNATGPKSDPDNPELVLNADILAPKGFGEIVGGSQREDDFETLKGLMEKQGMDLKVFDWYLDLRRYGSVPHSGFGIGIERTVRWVSGIHHVRETSAFPRMLNRITP